MARFDDIMGKLREQGARTQHQLRGKTRTGTISEVDAARGRARVRLQEGDTPFVTGWLPWSEPSAGANKTHTPPSVGQQVQIASESGFLTDAVIQGSLNSDANGRPSSKGDEVVLASLGDASVVVTDGGSAMSLKVGGAELKITSAGFEFTGGKVTNNGTNIGDTHTHGGVLKGVAKTDTPS